MQDFLYRLVFRGTSAIERLASGTVMAMDRLLITGLFAAFALADLCGCACPPTDARGFEIDREVTAAELEAFVAERAGYEAVKDVECEDLCVADVQQERGRTVETLDRCEFDSPRPGGDGEPGRLRCTGDSFVVCEG